MLLDNRLKQTGEWLFRYRSYWVTVLIPMLGVILFLERDELSSGFATRLAERSYELMCLGIALLGEFVRVLTVGFIPTGTSGRNTQSQKASVLNTTGTYSVMRNPLYLGNFLILMGIVMLLRLWEVAVLTGVFFTAIYIPIILAEESFLLGKFGDAYRAYVSRVPCLLPKPQLWSAPDLKWQTRMVLRREHDTVFSIVLSFVVVSHMRAYLMADTPRVDVMWLAIGGVCMALWLVAKFLKRFTTLLKSRDKQQPAASGQNGAA